MAIRTVLGRKLENYSYEESQLVTGDVTYAIAALCLNAMKGDAFPNLIDPLNSHFKKFIDNGHLNLIKKFVEAGFKPPPSVVNGIHNIKNNTVETINYLVQHGYDISKDEWSISCLMKSKKLSPSDFEHYLHHGLPLELIILGFNLLEVAFQTDNLEIAMFVCKKGLRLSKDRLEKGDSHPIIQDRIHFLITSLAIPVAFEEVYLPIMHAGNRDATSTLSFMSRDIIDEIAKSFLAFKYEVISNDLYR